MGKGALTVHASEIDRRIHLDPLVRYREHPTGTTKQVAAEWTLLSQKSGLGC